MSVYVFSAKKLLENKSKGGSFIEQMIDKMFGGMSDEIALTAYDSNTVAFGSFTRVKDAIGNTKRIKVT